LLLLQFLQCLLVQNKEQITSKITCNGQTTLRDAVFDTIGHLDLFSTIIRFNGFHWFYNWMVSIGYQSL